MPGNCWSARRQYAVSGDNSADVPDPDIFDAYRKRLNKRARGQTAPHHIISCIEAAVSLPFDEGIAQERKLFKECMSSPQSAAMRHAFFAERAAGKIVDLPADTVARKIDSVGIIGAGTMGGGIAMCFVNTGMPVVLIETSEEALQNGLDKVARNYAISVKKGRLSEQQASERQGLLSGSTDYQALADVDLVIDAVFEDPDIKKSVFKQLDAVCKDDAVLASNTSYQDLDAIAAATARPESVIGMHFFQPGQRDASAGKRAWRKDRTRCHCHSNGCGQENRQGLGSFAGVLRFYRQSHAQALRATGRPVVNRRGNADPYRFGDGRLRYGHGTDCGGPTWLVSISATGHARLCRRLSGAIRASTVLPTCWSNKGRCGQKTGAGFYRYDPTTRAPPGGPGSQCNDRRTEQSVWAGSS